MSLQPLDLSNQIEYHHRAMQSVIRNRERNEEFVAIIQRAGAMDPVINSSAVDLFASQEYALDGHHTMLQHLWDDHGKIFPKPEDWFGLSEDDRSTLREKYLLDLQAGGWEFNEWGDVIDQVEPWHNAMTRGREPVDPFF